jgi:cell fate (sporulation/competence/biofilm development) regulator YlbF (YheA/YmcA/DUF963 family)
MLKKHIKAEDKARSLQSAWRQESPTTTFASMTLEQYDAEIQIVTNLSREIQDLDNLAVAKKARKRAAEAVLNNLNKQVVNSVRSTPGFGDDAPLLRAFGYVITSERKSGLHRVPAAPVVAANAAPVIIPSGIVPAGVNEMGGTNAA